MRYLGLILVLFSAKALACWNMKGELFVGDKKVSINQKLDHDKTYSFSNAPYIFHVKVVSEDKRPADVPKKPGTHLVVINVDEKQGVTLKEVATGMILVETGKQATMIKQDNENGQTSKFIVKLTEI